MTVTVLPAGCRTNTAKVEPVVGACLVMAAMQGMTVRRRGAAERKVLENIRDGAMAVFHV